MSRITIICLIYLICGIVAPAALAEVGVVKSEMEAQPKKFGAFLGIGNPFPTLLGLNGAYNISKDFRAAVGYGEIEVTTSIGFNGTTVTSETVKAQSYAMGGEYLFLDSVVRPLIGIHAGYFDISGRGKINVSGFKKSTAHLYSKLGVDWISEGGYELGAGANWALVGASGSSFYMTSGWYF